MKTVLSVGILFFTTLVYRVSAQQIDSTQIVYSQEIDSLPVRPESRFARAVYRRFVRARVEEKTLIKAGILPTSAGFGADGYSVWGFKSEVAIERKLTPAFSVLIASRTQYRHFSTSQNGSAIFNGLLAGRWYYNMPNRIRKGKSANNFSEQYITLELDQLIWPKITASTPISVYPRSGPLVRMAFGAQRRLGRFVYLDTSIGVTYLRNRPRPLGINLTFMVGLGL